jgi:hypothetical protein
VWQRPDETTGNNNSSDDLMPLQGNLNGSKANFSGMVKWNRQRDSG